MGKAAYDADVVVAGAGPAGIGAALATARTGARTVLIERYGIIGGNMAMGLPMYSFHDREKNLVVRGIPLEFVRRLARSGGAVGPIPNGKGSLAYLDPEVVKTGSIEMLLEAGVVLLLHAEVGGVEKDGDQVLGVRVRSKGEPDRLVRARVFVDATGDGDVAAAAGCPFEKGRREDGAMQPATLVFLMDDVDTEGIRRQVLEDAARYECSLPRFSFESPYYIFSGFRAQVRQAIEEGLLPRDFPQPHVIFSTLPRPGAMALNFMKVLGIDGSRAEDLARGEVKARSELPRVLAFLQSRVPGFEKARFSGAAHQIGIRETRRVMGEYVITGQDVLEQRRFDDAVAVAYYPVDIHGEGGGEGRVLEPGGCYTIPFRSLVPRGIRNLLVAGRCISSTREAQGAVRVMGICMAMGEAAGTAAGLCVQNGCGPRELDAGLLRLRLDENGANVGL